jgi:hypothetical protein
MGERNTYHVDFNKSMGDVTVSSYGGGYPRTVTITKDRDELRMKYSEARDLHYALGRLLIEIGEEKGDG